MRIRIDKVVIRPVARDKFCYRGAGRHLEKVSISDKWFSRGRKGPFVERRSSH